MTLNSSAKHGTAGETCSEVRIGGRTGDLCLPPQPVGLVLFAHGSGSSRFSVRNREVAQRLREEGLGTLLFDLLGEAEAGDRRKVFDIPLLAGRLTQAVDWVGTRPDLAALPIGLFGASTGAAAALVAAAARPRVVAAVVSRGGRPDLAHASLPHVTAPTLLIVGGLDGEVLALNRDASRALTCAWHLEIVPGATHLFEEPGTLDRVAMLAARWFRIQLVPKAGAR